MSTTTQENTTQEQQQVKVPDFGKGRYSALMRECYKDAQVVFGMTPESAEALARQIGCDYGALMQQTHVAIGDIKFGKPNKDMQVTIREAAAKLKGVTLSDTLYALRALNFALQSISMGFVWGKTKWVVSDSLAEFLKKF